MTDQSNPSAANSDRASTSVRHAYFERRVRELGVLDKDADYGGMIGQTVLELSRVFARQGHSGNSASSTLGLFNQLMAEYDGGGLGLNVGNPGGPLPDHLRATLGAAGPTPGEPMESDWRRERAARENEAGNPMNQTQFKREVRNVLTPEGIRQALESADARRWAQAFMQLQEEQPSRTLDEGVMIGWFANAIMRGHDDATNAVRDKFARLRRLELLRAEICDVLNSGIDLELL